MAVHIQKYCPKALGQKTPDKTQRGRNLLKASLSSGKNKTACFLESCPAMLSAGNFAAHFRPTGKKYNKLQTEHLEVAELSKRHKVPLKKLVPFGQISFDAAQDIIEKKSLVSWKCSVNEPTTQHPHNSEPTELTAPATLVDVDAGRSVNSDYITYTDLSATVTALHSEQGQTGSSFTFTEFLTDNILEDQLLCNGAEYDTKELMSTIWQRAEGAPSTFEAAPAKWDAATLANAASNVVNWKVSKEICDVGAPASQHELKVMSKQMGWQDKDVVRHIIKKFVDYMRDVKNYAEKTVLGYSSKLTLTFNSYMSYLGLECHEVFSEKHLLNVIVHCEKTLNHTKGIKTQEAYLSALKCFCTWLRLYKYISGSGADNVLAHITEAIKSKTK